MQYMSIQRHGLVTRLSILPVESELGNWQAEGTTNNSRRAVFIDVGGGGGHQAIAFSQECPNLRRVVLQENNFFKGQPEKGE